MAKKKTDKAKRATVEVHCECKRCQAPLVVKVFRNIVTPAVPAEVELETVVDIDKQQRLDLLLPEPEGADKVAVEEEKTTAPKVVKAKPKVTKGGGKKKAGKPAQE